MLPLKTRHTNPRRAGDFVCIVAALLLALYATPTIGININTNSKAFRDKCESTLKSNVYVHLETVPTLVTHARSVVTLQAKSAKATTAGHTPVGLTEADLSVNYKWTLHTLRESVTGATCAAMDLHVYVTAGQQILSVASEIPADSCAYQFVYNHEVKHVRVNEEHARRVAERLEMALKNELENRVFYSSKEDIPTTLKSLLQSKWSTFGQQLLSEVHKRHTQIDSASEYEAANQVCDQQIPKILTRYRLRNNSAQIREINARGSH